MEIKKELSLKRKELMEKCNSEIQNSIRDLGKNGISEEEKIDIEKRIQEAKTKIKELINEENQSKFPQKSESKFRPSRQYV